MVSFILGASTITYSISCVTIIDKIDTNLLDHVHQAIYGAWIVFTMNWGIHQGRDLACGIVRRLFKHGTEMKDEIWFKLLCT